jgi:AraC-like DNA-binding protein
MERTVQAAPQTRQCFAGLCYSLVPIRVGANVIAFLHTGGVLLRAPTPPRLKQTMRALSRLGAPVDAKRLRRAYVRTRVLTTHQYAAVVSLVAIFALHLAAISNQLMVAKEHLELPLIYKTKLFIIEHQGEDLTLQRAARSVNCSVSYFCTMFKKATGLTFTAYLGRVRVEKVQSLLLNPYINISEAAYEAGFQSLSQFNRVFQKIAGETPSAWRGKLGLSSSESG